MSRCFIAVQNSILVSPECKAYLSHSFVQTHKDAFIVFLIDCLYFRAIFSMYNTCKIKNKLTTLFLHLTDFDEPFSIMTNLDSSTAMIVSQFLNNTQHNELKLISSAISITVSRRPESKNFAMFLLVIEVVGQPDRESSMTDSRTF